MSCLFRRTFLNKIKSSVLNNNVFRNDRQISGSVISSFASKRYPSLCVNQYWNHARSNQLFSNDAYEPRRPQVHNTTIICVRKGNDVVLMGDGQMSIGNVVAKHNSKKLRKLSGGKVIAGFAGDNVICGAADGIALIDLLEKKLSEREVDRLTWCVYVCGANVCLLRIPTELRRACVETTKLWRTDKILRRLEALLIVADEKSTFELTGNGELVESETGIIAIGSGGHFAEAAARALIDSDLSADEIATKAMKIAADMCVYTNHHTLKLKLVKEKGIVEDTSDSKQQL
ncbi:ATP-dependent protease peptidase subunit [Reticulomyxa filosa]|uniref:ATP-dependent protease peptidase subunit n=1 Tax=Reticulomyxa filosa TaxID=46433 RepID=X6PH06_RETFI|nr:ATP-dependent protease peptidase subunit [Reticulomyxa filosa]|eukprot:ETO36967.1 ATP-dependent protease peptidase subunit [Reticulomyxa filosa]